MNALEKDVIAYLCRKEGWSRERTVIEFGGEKYFFAGQKFKMGQVLDVCLQTDPFERIFYWYLLHTKGFCGTLYLIVRSDHIKKRIIGILYHAPVSNILKNVKVRSLHDIGFIVKEEQQSAEVSRIFAVHIQAPACIRQFASPLYIERGSFLTAIYLRSQGFNEAEIINYLSLIKNGVDFSRVVNWVFDKRLSWDKITCETIKKKPANASFYQASIGDLVFQCDQCQRMM